MKSSSCHYLWRSPEVIRNYTMAASLHGHTMNSRESLAFLPRIAGKTPILAGSLRRHAKRYKEYYGTDMDMSRAWWTPPLSPREAWALEANQIENQLGLGAYVSLTDHDDIEGPMHLQVLPETRGVPVSFEWTVPYAESYVHLGVHNLPPKQGHDMVSALAGYTNKPSEALLAELLDELHSNPEILIVFNHPLWDEQRIGGAYHRSMAIRFLRQYRQWLHAVELNGLRPWGENNGVVQMAAEHGMTLISGGDRHGREPNGTLNLTRAADFSEFVAEIRQGKSEVLFMNQCREPIRLRIMQGLLDVVRDYNDLPVGRRRWTDRVFFRCDDGEVRPLSALFIGDGPEIIRWFMLLVRLLGSGPVQGALRVALAERQEGTT